MAYLPLLQEVLIIIIIISPRSSLTPVGLFRVQKISSYFFVLVFHGLNFEVFVMQISISSSRILMEMMKI